MELKGLSSSEVKKNIKEFGTNKLSQKETKSFLSFFIESLKDKWILILFAAMFIKIGFNIFTIYTGIGHVDWYEVYSVAFAILLSTLFATWSNYTNEKKFSNLQAESNKIITKCLRDGKVTEVLIDDLTMNDLVIIQSGDKVPFDGILLKGNIKVNQASLNGESEDAKKIQYDGSNIENDDLFSKFKVFRGSVVTEGDGVLKATEIGDKTVIGTINTSLQEELKKSPSEIKLEKLANQIGKMGYTAGAIYFVMSLILSFSKLNGNYDINNMFSIFMNILMFSVTIVIMAVPEGLPMMLAMVAGMNSKRLLSQNILVRNPDSIETAGYTNILFSDKTGTITKGVLSVVEFILGNGTSTKDINELKEITHLAIKGIGLNNESMVSSDNQAIGSNGTDRALLNYLIEKELHLDLDQASIIERVNFNSATKFASVKLNDGTTFVKGAAEIIHGNCEYYYDKNGNIKKFSELDLINLQSIQTNRAEKSMRILGISHIVDGKEIFISFICIRDDLRDGMNDTINTLKTAGVQVVMVTGDRLQTAKAIAEDCGIYNPNEDLAITHQELDEMSDEELKENLSKIKVISRALPMDKKRLVNVSQELNNVTGMTGDGVNDSPALKSSDIGYSMGDGSETAKESSDVAILNNSLTSIEKAILFGRTMTKSVQKFIIFQLTVNVSVILLSLISPILNWSEPFTIVQILWINLIMDTLAALAFGEEPALNEYMYEKPTPKYDNILTTYMKSQIGVASSFIVIISLLLFTNLFGIQDLIINSKDETTIRTFIFTFFVYSVIFNGFNTRTTGYNIFKNITKNMKFIYVMGGILIAQSLLIQFAGKIFSTTPMDLKHYLLAFGLALLIIPIDFVRKFFINKK